MRKCIIRGTIVFIASWMALAGDAYGAESGDTVVNIPDPGLESALRSGLVLDKLEGDITVADLESLEVISTSGMRGYDIADLTGLEHWLFCPEENVGEEGGWMYLLK